MKNSHCSANSIHQLLYFTYTYSISLSAKLLVSLLVIIKSYFDVNAGCSTSEEGDSRQCDTDTLDRQQNYDEDWVSVLKIRQLQQNVM